MPDTSTKLPEPTDVPIPPRYWWLKRIAIGVVVLLLLVVGLRLWWGYSVDRRIDAMIAEYHAASQPILPEDFVTDPVPDEENAVWYYQQAAAAITMPAGATITIDDIVKKPELLYTNNDQVTTIISANQTAIELARQAKQASNVHWNINARKLTIAWMPGLSAHRNGIKLHIVAASKDAAEDNHSEALHDLDVALSWADTVQKYPSLIAHLIAISGHAMVCDTLERFGPTIAHGQSRQQIEELINRYGMDGEVPYKWNEHFWPTPILVFLMVRCRSRFSHRLLHLPQPLRAND